MTDLTAVLTGRDLFRFVLDRQDDRLREALAGGVTPMVQRDGLTPLHVAAACDNLDAASILFEAGAYIDAEAWPESSRLAAFRRLHRHESSPARESAVHPLNSDLWDEVDRRTRRSFQGQYKMGALGCTPLHLASDRGCAPMARWLLERGADAHLSMYLDGGPEGFWEWSALELAVGQQGESAHTEVVELLQQWVKNHPKTDADEAIAAFRERRVPI